MASTKIISDIRKGLSDALSQGDVRAVGQTSADKLIGIFQTNPPARGTKETLAAYSMMPWLRATIDKIGSSIATATWRVFVKTKTDVEGKRRPVKYRQLGFMNERERRAELLRLKNVGDLVEIEDHPIIDSLYATGPTFTGYTTRELSQKWLDLVGEAFWIKDRNETGMPMNFVPVPPTWVQNTPSPEKDFFEVATPGGTPLEVPQDDMLWFYHPDPEDPYKRGSGMGFTLGDELQTDEYAAKFMKTFFYNSARPDILVSSNELKKEDTQRLERKWLDKLRGWQRSFLPFFLNREVKVHQLGTDYSHLSMLELRKWERDAVIQVYGVPPEVLGIVEASNRATSEVAEYLYARWVLTPRLEFMRQIMQHHLVPEYDDRLILDYDSPVAQDKEYLLKVATIAPWTLFVDEWREMQGKLPLPDGKGQVFAKPLNYEFITLEDYDDPPSQQGPAEAPEDQDPENEKPTDDDEGTEEDPPEEEPEEEVEESIQPTWPALATNVISRQRVTPRIGTRHDQIAVRVFDAFNEIADNARKVHEGITVHCEDGDFEEAIDLILRQQSVAGAIEPVMSKLTSIYVLAIDLEVQNLSFFMKDDSEVSALEPMYEIGMYKRQFYDALQKWLRDGLVEVLANLGEEIPAEDIAFALIDSIGISPKYVDKFVEHGCEGDEVLGVIEASIEEITDHAITHMCNGAQESLWSEAVKEGILDNSKVTRIWITRLGCRSCNECAGMDGVTADIDSSWNLENGDTVVTPTKAHAECHCTERLVRKEAKK